MFLARLGGVSVLVVAALAACGGQQAAPVVPSSTSEADRTTAAKPPSDSAHSEPVDEADEGPLAVPSTCHGDSEPCVPNPQWVRRLCQDVYPGVALYLFQSSIPFSHAYLTRRTRAVNASGGATSGDEWLAFDEEVVLLHHRGEDAGGIQVSGSGGGYDAIRLDGSCVTLGAEEVRMERPPAPKYTKIAWQYLGEDIQDALRAVPAVREAYIARRQECRGAYSGAVSGDCVKKDEALHRAIVAALKSGEAKLPVPATRP